MVAARRKYTRSRAFFETTSAGARVVGRGEQDGHQLYQTRRRSARDFRRLKHFPGIATRYAKTRLGLLVVINCLAATTLPD